MERGPLLRTVASLMFPFMAVLVLYLLLNGHNRAGGGFIAGVLMAGVIGFQYLAHGYDQVPKFLCLPYRIIMAAGLLVSVVVGTVALIKGFPFLTSFHRSAQVPVLGVEMEFALAQAFDAGIFLLVVGGLMTAVLALRED
ncbi:MAG: Na(+)/H(+) antiporter subunit B [Chloroflexi bacterium]|nr:Na(+)/H(+) antiporter subunit B [Chloroflexota bacterium]